MEQEHHYQQERNQPTWREEGSAQQQQPEQAFEWKTIPKEETDRQPSSNQAMEKATSISPQDLLLEQEQTALEEQLGFSIQEQQATTPTLEEEDKPPFPYDSINWEQISKREYLLKAGEKISIYKIAKTMGWPSDRATHSHIINYIRKSAALANIIVVDKNYLQVSQNKKLFVPVFGAYRDYFEVQGEKDPKFKEFYREHLEKYQYPEVITEPEQQLYTTQVFYKNPVSLVEEVVPVAETFYGQWYLNHIEAAKEHYNRDNTLYGFRYHLLNGVPRPVHVEATIGKDSYRAYDKKEWQQLPWQERVNYFDIGLDRRLEEDKGPLKKHYEQTVRENGGEVEGGIKIAHSASGEEVFGKWEQEILNWEEGNMSNTEVVEKEKNKSEKIIRNTTPSLSDYPPTKYSLIEEGKGDLLKNGKEKEEQKKKEYYDKMTYAYEAQAHGVVAGVYTEIEKILKKWESPDHQPTSKEVDLMQKYKHHLKEARLGFWHPNMQELQQLLPAFREATERSLYPKPPILEIYQPPQKEEDTPFYQKTEQQQSYEHYKSMVQDLEQAAAFLPQHLNQETMPSLKELECLSRLRKAFEQQPLGFSLEWENFQNSALRGDTLIEKYGSTRNWETPGKIQGYRRERKKRWSSKKEE